MKDSRLSFKILIISVCLAAGFQTHAQQQSEEKNIISLHKNKFRWMSNKNLDSLEKILDERLVYIHSSGWTENKKELLDDLQSGKLLMNYVTVSESRVSMIDSHTAILYGKAVFNVMREGKPADINLYYTEVYIREKSQWKLVSRLATKI